MVILGQSPDRWQEPCVQAPHRRAGRSPARGHPAHRSSRPGDGSERGRRANLASRSGWIRTGRRAGLRLGPIPPRGLSSPPPVAGPRPTASVRPAPPMRSSPNRAHRSSGTAIARTVVVLTTAASGCGEEPDLRAGGAHREEVPRVVASIFPLADLAAWVGGDDVLIGVLAPPRAAPATFEPCRYTFSIRSADRAWTGARATWR